MKLKKGCFTQWTNFIIDASTSTFTAPCCVNIIDLKTKVNYKCQPINIDPSCVCCGKNDHLFSGCSGGTEQRATAATVHHEADQEWMELWDFQLLVSLSFQVWRIWLVFHKVKSNSSMWFVSELIMMINWLSTQISSERCQAARHQG